MFTPSPIRKYSLGIPKLCRAAVVFALSLVLTSSWMQAQQETESDESIVKLDPFTVVEEEQSPWKSQLTFSGSRIAENVMDVPTNISIVTDKFIKDVGAYTLNDLLNYAGSGVNSRVSYRDDFSIRGFRQGATWNGLGGTSYANVPLYDLERVEFIKGPIALVFSDVGNTGGTVNYVTKRPTAKSQGDLSALIGLDGRYGFDVTQRGPINEAGSVRYRLTAGAQEYDGFRELEYEDNRLVSASVDWDVSKSFSVKFDAQYWNVTRRDFNRDLVDPVTGKLVKIKDDFSTTAEWAKVNNTQFRTKIEAIYRPTSNLSARVLYGTYDSQYDYNLPQPFPGLDASESPNYTKVGQRLLNFDLDSLMKDLQADLTWLGDFGAVQNRFTAGWAHSESGTTQNFYLGALPDILIGAPISQRPGPSDPSTWTTLSSNRQSRGSGWSGYVQDSVTLLDGKLIASAGIRYVDAGATSKNESVTVPRYGLVYKFNNETSVYYGRSESFRPLTGKDILGRDYTDITGSNQEVGLKLDLFDGKVFGSVAYFDMLVDPVVTQVQVTDSQGNILYGNVQSGKETNKGFEADIGVVLDAGPGQWLTLGTLYNADPKNASGLRPARVVAYKATLFTKYDFTSGPMSGFSFGGGISDFGGQVGTGIAKQDGYALYSLIFSYTTKDWKLALNIDNVTDVQDAVVGSEASFSVYTARPRDARLTLSRSW